MQKLKGHLDVKFINTTFFPNHHSKQINDGQCFLWAYLAYRLYSNLELWDMGAHAFVRSKVTGKFYDSEKPNGEEDWKDLPATNFGHGCGCPRCQKPAGKFLTAGKFRHSWRGMAKRYRTDWQQVHQQILKVLNER